MKSDLPYLGHISDAIAAIETYVAGGRETFLRGRMIQDAVIRNFEVIGEASAGIDDPHQQKRSGADCSQRLKTA